MINLFDKFGLFFFALDRVLMEYVWQVEYTASRPQQFHRVLLISLEFFNQVGAWLAERTRSLLHVFEHMFHICGGEGLRLTTRMSLANASTCKKLLVLPAIGTLLFSWRTLAAFTLRWPRRRMIEVGGWDYHLTIAASSFLVLLLLVLNHEEGIRVVNLIMLLVPDFFAFLVVISNDDLINVWFLAVFEVEYVVYMAH